MHTAIKEQGLSEDKKQKVFIASVNAEDSRDVVSHAVGSEEVTVRSNVPSWGAVPVKGKEHLKVLRDAMIEICKMKEIE